jgi:hypothetical protein
LPRKPVAPKKPTVPKRAPKAKEPEVKYALMKAPKRKGEDVDAISKKAAIDKPEAVPAKRTAKRKKACGESPGEVSDFKELN